MMIDARGARLAPQYSRTRMGSARTRQIGERSDDQLYLIPFQPSSAQPREVFNELPCKAAVAVGGVKGLASSEAGKAPGADLHAVADVSSRSSVILIGGSSIHGDRRRGGKLYTRPAAARMRKLASHCLTAL